MGAWMVAKKGGAFAEQARSVDMLWGRQERSSRGPKPSMSVEQIVAAAIGIADAEGLQAVSMQRVAAEFGFTTMSLYRYVPGKNELIDLMIDTAVGPPPDLAGIPGGWRPKLAEWARQTWAVFRRHPWFIGAAGGGRLMGPNQLGWLESAVAALSGHGLVGEELVESVLVVNGHVRSLAQFAATLAGPEQPSEDQWVSGLVDLLRQHRERFPALTAAIEDGAFVPAPDDPLDFGLRRVLDGIAVLIEQRTR